MLFSKNTRSSPNMVGNIARNYGGGFVCIYKMRQNNEKLLDIFG